VRGERHRHSTIKQRRLPDQLQNLAERIGLNSRYYLKTNGITETLVPDELAPELVRESAVHFLQLNAIEVAIQLTLQDFSIFRQIEPTEYVDDLFELKSKYGTPMLEQFAALVNKEMFWVVTEVCSEHNPVRRMKIIKQFIKVAREWIGGGRGRRVLSRFCGRAMQVQGISIPCLPS
jgi:Rap guanine nucleotide exchange factor 2